MFFLILAFVMVFLAGVCYGYANAEDEEDRKKKR